MPGEEPFTPERITIVSALVGALIGALRGWWYPGMAYDEMRTERDFYRDLALNLLQTNERAIGVIESSTMNDDHAQGR